MTKRPQLQRTLSSAITVELREEILSGHHPAGTQLRQDALAKSFGVSRIPVREALFQLEAEGLVRLIPQKGAIVPDLSSAEIEDVFELRAVLEPRLLARALPPRDEAYLAQAEAIHARFVAAADANDVRAWGVLNAEFHMALYAGADLPRTTIIVASLLQTSDRYTRLQLSRPEAMKRAVREHSALLALCRAGDSAPACEFLRDHIRHVGEDLLRVVQRGDRGNREPDGRPGPTRSRLKHASP